MAAQKAYQINSSMAISSGKERRIHLNSALTAQDSESKMVQRVTNSGKLAFKANKRIIDSKISALKDRSQRRKYQHINLTRNTREDTHSKTMEMKGI